MFRYSSKKNYVKTANRSFNDVNFDFFNGKFDKYSRNKNNYNSSYNLNSDKKLKTSDCLTYDVSTKSLSFGTFPVSQQNTPENKRHSLNTKNRNTTDARKFLQNFSELKIPGSSNNEADENLKFMQLLNGDNESDASKNRPTNSFDLPFATEILGSLDGPSVNQNNFSEFTSSSDNAQPSRKIDFAQLLNGKNGNSAFSSDLDESLDLEFEDNSAASFDLSDQNLSGLEDSLDQPSENRNNFSKFPSTLSNAQPSGKFDFAQFLNGKNSASNDETLYQPTVNRNDQQESNELANIFDASIDSSYFNKKYDLMSDNHNESEHNYVQYLNKNRK